MNILSFLCRKEARWARACASAKAGESERVEVHAQLCLNVAPAYQLFYTHIKKFLKNLRKLVDKSLYIVL